MTELMKLKEAFKDVMASLQFYAESEWNDNYPGGVKYKIQGNDEERLDTGQLARHTVKKYWRFMK